MNEQCYHSVHQSEVQEEYIVSTVLQFKERSETNCCYSNSEKSANNHNQDGDWIIKVDQKKGTLAYITNYISANSRNTHKKVTMFPNAVRTNRATKTTQVKLIRISLHLGSPWQFAI